MELLANHAGLLIESGKDIDQGLTTLNRLRLLSQDAAILKYVNTMSKVAEQKKMERKQ